MRKPIITQPVATNVITGFLGVGKTTLIKYLLANKPANQVWAVLVNEFGEVGIDASFIGKQSGKVQIKEVAGGCICCAAGVPIQVAVNQLLAQAKPDRLLIEPTGLGHPKAIIDTLSQPHYQQVIALKSTICLVDARKVSDNRYRESDIFKQQLAVADLIFVTKGDLAADENLAQLHTFLAQQSISAPVQAINLTREQESQTPALFNRLAEQVLDCDRDSVGALAPTKAPVNSPDSSPSLFSVSPLSPLSSISEPSMPPTIVFDELGIYRNDNQHEGIYSAGWVFDCHYEFDFEAIVAWVKRQDCLRLKALLICDEGIATLNYVDQQLQVVELDDALDSRIELISRQPITISATEQQLLSLAKRDIV